MTSPAAPILAILFPSQEVGGAERYVQTLARVAGERGWSVIARFPDSPVMHGLHQELRRAGVRTAPLALGNPISTPGPRAAALHATRELIRTWAAVARSRADATLLMLPHPDQSPGAVLGVALFPRRCAVVVQLVPATLEMSPARRGLYRFARVTGQRWITVSEDNRTRLADATDLQRAALDRIYNGVELFDDAPHRRSEAAARVRAELQLPATARVILTVARLSRQKGHDVLLEAIPDVAARHPDAVWVWAGDGEDRASLRERIERAGLGSRVRVLGHRDDARELLLAADLFVLPSRAEGMPLALLEAMAAATPVIATSIGPMRELIEDGVNGLLVPVEDPVALALAMDRALTDPAAGRQRATSALTRVRQHHSAEAMAERTLAVLSAPRRLGGAGAG